MYQDKTLEQILEDNEYKELVKSKAALYFILGGDREDLVQEGMVGLVKAYNSFDQDKNANFKTYASHCIENEIINAIKAAARKKHSPLNESLEIPESLPAGRRSSPEDELIYKEFWDNLKTNKDNIFGKLEHEVFLRLLQGETYLEIASALSKTPKQIDNAIQRIKAKIKRL